MKRCIEILPCKMLLKPKRTLEERLNLKVWVKIGGQTDKPGKNNSALPWILLAEIFFSVYVSRNIPKCKFNQKLSSNLAKYNEINDIKALYNTIFFQKIEWNVLSKKMTNGSKDWEYAPVDDNFLNSKILILSEILIM